jgi:diguanylate cyclase (GGDEF)-like protein
VHQLAQSSTLIGRAADADIVVDDEGVSRRHAKLIRFENGVVLLKDLGSTNGTFVNGKQVKTHPLADGDRVQVGTTAILKFSIQDNLESQFQRHLYTAATRDRLTDLFNKGFFEEQLRRDYSYSRRHGATLSLAMADLDNFKQVNDTHGHQAGDCVLREFARLVGSMVRGEDVMCRVGGEEFALLMRSTDRNGAVVVCERLREAVAGHIFEVCGGKRLSITASFGVAELEVTRHPTPAALVEEADLLLYAAKRGGRNQTQWRK